MGEDCLTMFVQCLATQSPNFGWHFQVLLNTEHYSLEYNALVFSYGIEVRKGRVVS